MPQAVIAGCVVEVTSKKTEVKDLAGDVMSEDVIYTISGPGEGPGRLWDTGLCI